MISIIKNGETIISIIVRSSFNKEGVTFFTPDEFSQQLAFMSHRQGKIILPHVHKLVKREIMYTKEVLVLRSGKLKVDFYSDEQQFIGSDILCGGDVILLAAGGHGFEVLEDVEMFEVKQGPYAGEDDKVRFAPMKRETLQ